MGLLSFLGLDGQGRTVSPTDRLPVDIGENVSVQLGAEVEVKNDTGNPVPVNPITQARTPTTASVASSATSATLLAANSNRRGLSIANLSTSTLDLSFSTPATAANCFIRLPAGSFILLDQQLIVTNAIYGIWASANGTAQITEYV